jgi:hypothetical protein
MLTLGYTLVSHKFKAHYKTNRKFNISNDYIRFIIADTEKLRENITALIDIISNMHALIN